MICMLIKILQTCFNSALFRSSSSEGESISAPEEGVEVSSFLSPTSSSSPPPVSLAKAEREYKLEDRVCFALKFSVGDGLFGIVAD